MGLTFSTFVRKLFGRKQLRILIVGLGSAGKTTILYRMKMGEDVTPMPTLGFNVETVEYKNICFIVWDVGGQDKVRRLWQQYYANTFAIIFVVDSTDKERMPLASSILHSLLDEEELSDALVLVYANKQDLPHALSVVAVKDMLRLDSVQHRKWYIQGTCAVTGSGLYEGLDWLADHISNK
ncbi:ADP-ribosylation factor 4-like [Schistocerca americana]|uniref:ADP-ribosylation factor 4-like n=1 Tax=Schistocerca americana TaxID=7009 RepID=UPI001F4F347B|nr:ADP-ribosylation factor 4-like [Schistocerca americana]XP_047096998.1 ADP-ribosylation factor 4-like [Schistocerca piceifrons]XP_049773603.1 ADP-ribosylation factor 4-like [Schistocerca cancellata]XP_049863509.1 ADP-ribosylation factor 4-like [Schistocerca gregaria]XP_049950111.1 ADP-ribosylation factor 4-like [Schistocerca serialis cubense]